MNRITGIFTPNLTPVDEAKRVDEDKLCGYIDWLIEHEVDGLYPSGSTGEFVRFSSAERRRIVEVVTKHTANRVPILAGTVEADAKQTIETCEHFGSLGVRAVAIVSPYYHRLSGEAVYAYYREIANHVSVDVLLYNIPIFATPIESETVIRLALECPRIVGMKDSSGDLPYMLRILAAVRPARDEFSFLTGWDASLAPTLLAGADGGTLATSGIVPELTRSTYDHVQAGNVAEAMKDQHRLLPLFDAIINLGEFPDGVRAGTRSRGWDLGNGRLPQTENQRESIAKGQAEIDDLVKTCLLSSN